MSLNDPLVLALIAAGGLAVSNAIAAVVNGRQQRLLEREKAQTQLDVENKRIEASRILQMIGSGNPDQVAENMKFLVDSGLINSRELEVKIRAFLESRIPGTGPALAQFITVTGVPSSSTAGTPNVTQSPPSSP